MPRSARLRPVLGTALLAVGLVGALLTGCSDQPANEPSDAAATGDVDRTSADLDVRDALTGLSTPWGLVTFRDGRYLLGSRDTGEIALISPDAPEVAEVVATIDGVRAEGESGLLGLAVSPDERTVFAYFTTEDDSRVVSMSWNGSALAPPEVLVEGIPGGATFHQGGGMVVGPDDLLYLSTGDNGVPENAQDRDSLSGKVLRYTLGGEPAPGNPFDSAVFSLGHRNVEGLAFDDAGRLWASEFGQNEYDELNLVEPGNNYGWPAVEGTGGGDRYVDPQVVWRTEDASPAGLAYWDGSLWMAALRGQTLWEIPLADGEADEPVAHLTEQYGRLRTAHLAPDGTGLLVGTSNTDGRGEPRDDDDRLLLVTR